MQPTKAGSVSASEVSISSVRQALQAWDALVIRPRPRRWTKRSFDVLASGLGLLVSAPLWALIALSIKLQDGGRCSIARNASVWRESASRAGSSGRWSPMRIHALARSRLARAIHA